MKKLYSYFKVRFTPNLPHTVYLLKVDSTESSNARTTIVLGIETENLRIWLGDTERLETLFC